MTDVNPALRADMESKGIDVALSLSILGDINAGLYDGIAPVRASRRAGTGRRIGHSDRPRTRAGPHPRRRPARGSPASGSPCPRRHGRTGNGSSSRNRPSRRSGKGSSPGRPSACSTADQRQAMPTQRRTWPSAAGPSRRSGPAFEALAPACKDRPKGLTPAYLEPRREPGGELPPPSRCARPPRGGPEGHLAK